MEILSSCDPDWLAITQRVINGILAAMGMYYAWRARESVRELPAAVVRRLNGDAPVAQTKGPRNDETTPTGL